MNRYLFTLFQLIVIATILVSCNSDHQAPCQTTTREFINLFNSQDFRGVVTLFQRNLLKSGQIKQLSDNLEYIYGVAGEIKGMRFINRSDNGLNYVSIHENTAMDIVFQVDEQCELISYLINTHYPDSLPKLERNTTTMKLPFQGEWYVEWGGPDLEQNYHNAHRNMQGAFDFTMKDQNGKHYRDDGKSNEDYYAFGKEVISPCQATVVKVIDGIRDNPIGKPAAVNTYGNAIVLETKKEEFLLLAHLQEQSIVVKEGQQVNEGDLLARCGNSGYSNAPHLHFIVQNVADLFHPTGASCYFDSISVDGVLKRDYSPVQGELVHNY